MEFNFDFTRKVLLPLAAHAYTVAGLPRPCESSFAENGQGNSDGFKGLDNPRLIQVDPAKCKDVWKKLEDAHVPAASDMLAAVMADSHVFGFVAVGKFVPGVEREVFVCFRGTHFPQDWLKNVDLPLVDYSFLSPVPGGVHVGFQAVYETIRESVKNAIEEAGSLPLTIVGHSLGGALATLCALDADIAKLASGQPRVFSFASPRVGDGEFRDAFDKQVPECMRIVNKPDVVTHVPLPLPHIPLPQLLLTPKRQLDYRHVGLAAVVDGGELFDPLFSHGLCEGYSRGLNSTIAQPKLVLHKLD